MVSRRKKVEGFRGWVRKTWRGVAGGAGVALVLGGCAMICLSLYSRLFGLSRFLDSIVWWRPVSIGLILMGLTVLLLQFLFEASARPGGRRLPGRTTEESLRMVLQASVFVVSLFLFFQIPVLPANYYEKARSFTASHFSVPEEKTVESLVFFLSQLRLEYLKENVFDCSEASALVEWLCEGAGFHTLICLGYKRAGPSGERRLHTWVVVELDNGRRAQVEATNLTVLESPVNVFLSLYESPDDLIRGTFLLSAFDWWEVSPYDRMGSFSRWELFPPIFWSLLETPDRMTGYRIVSGVFFTLLFLAFYILLLRFLDFLYGVLRGMGGKGGFFSSPPGGVSESAPA